MTKITVTLYTNGTVSKVDGVGTGYSNSGDNSCSITISGTGALTVYVDNSDGSGWEEKENVTKITGWAFVFEA